MEISSIGTVIMAGMVAAGCIGLAVTKNLFYAAITLMIVFLVVAGLYVVWGAEFVGISQIVVYVGGVLVLIVFGILLTQRIQGYKVETSSYRIIPGLIVSGAFFYLLVNLIYNLPVGNHTEISKEDTVPQIGINLVTENILAFEAIAILLLVALIGASTIAKPEKE